MVDRRREPRIEVDFSVCVWGIDTKGDRFVQQARARDISFSGALLSQLEAELRSGDLVGILYAGRRARFRVVWVRYCGTSRKIQAAIQRLEQDECPWAELLVEPAATVESDSRKALPGTTAEP